MPTTAPYGSWKSPITSDLMTANVVSPGKIMIDAGQVYWSERRPEEDGRSAIEQLGPDGQPKDLLPLPYNARSRVHEYGGGDYLVHQGVIYFSNFKDQRLYRMTPGNLPEPISPTVDLRYADGVMDARRGRIICVREDHTGPQVLNTITALDANGADRERGGQVLVSGNDFYSDPRLDPQGARLAWLTWNNPNMPWDGTELWVADIQPDGRLANATRIAGGPEESIFQPEWSPEGQLYFISDRTGWWNLYRWDDDRAESQSLHPMSAEFGQPAWNFRVSTYAFESPEQLACTFSQNGTANLATLNTRTLELRVLDLPYTEFDSLRALPGQVLFIGGSPTSAGALVRLHLADGKLDVLRQSSTQVIDPGYLSIPQSLEYPTENGLNAYGIYYAPCNQDFTAPTGQKPPLLVLSHGGPTSATSTSLSLRIQYWTSRGFAILDVNYGGSTGYGRAYRERLNGQWGIVDVDDCVNGALYLARQGLVDDKRMAIVGGSAGGYTTLCALTFREVFQAGASHYGISDAEALATDTHKFEARYLDRLIGPYPQDKETYIQRSPIHFTHQLNCALILFQGSEDQVVPPAQSRSMFEAVRAKKLPVAYIEFEGEQHGFRKAANIRRSLDGELYFYSKVFKFDLAEPVEPVQIENLTP